jgi:hypothetical protein
MNDFLSKCLVKDSEVRSSSKSIVEHHWFKKEISILQKQERSKTLCSLPDLVTLAKRSKALLDKNQAQQNLIASAMDDSDLGHDVEVVEDVDSLTWDDDNSRGRGGSVERNDVLRQAWQTKHFNVSHAKGSPLQDQVQIDVTKISNKANDSEHANESSTDDRSCHTNDTFVYRKSSSKRSPLDKLNEDDTIEVANPEALRTKLNAQLEESLRIDKIDLTGATSPNRQQIATAVTVSRDADTTYLISQLELLSPLESARTNEGEGDSDEVTAGTSSSRVSSTPHHVIVPAAQTQTQLSRSHRSSTVSSTSSSHNTLHLPSNNSPHRQRRKSFVIDIPDKFVSVVDRLEGILAQMDDFNSIKFQNEGKTRRSAAPPVSSERSINFPPAPPVNSIPT